MVRAWLFGVASLLWFVPGVEAASIDCEQCGAWNKDQAPFRIFGNTYFVGTGVSSVLITSPNGHVLIDGALPQSAPLIAKHIEKLGFRVTDVKLILSSHVHFDHVGGLAELQKMSGTKVIASNIAAPYLRSGTVDWKDPQFGHLPPFPGVDNVEALGKSRTVELGSLQISVIHTPGHTPGGTSWRWKSCEEQRCLNIVYADSLNAVSDDAFKYSGDRRYPNAARDLFASIAAVSATPCDILVAAHPDATNMLSVIDAKGRGDRARLVDSSACKRYAEGAKERLQKRIEQEKPAQTPTQEPAPQQEPVPAPQPAPTQTQEPAQTPVSAPVPAPGSEQTPAPATEQTSAPASAPAQTPVQEQTPTPTSAPAPATEQTSAPTSTPVSAQEQEQNQAPK